MIITTLLLTTLLYAGSERRIDAKDLPAPILKALDERYPGAKILKAKREDKKDRVEYEVKACHAGRAVEVEFDADGRVTDVDDEGAC